MEAKIKMEKIILTKLSENLEFFNLQQTGVNWLRLTDMWHCQNERPATHLDAAHISSEVFFLRFKKPSVQHQQPQPGHVRQKFRQKKSGACCEEAQAGVPCPVMIPAGDGHWCRGLRARGARGAAAG